jgi:hypothetical protein
LINPDLILAKANLGVAYLVRPSGKDVGEATKFLQEAAEKAASDTTLDPLVRAAVLINAGVADLAGGQGDGGAAKFDQGEAASRQLAGRRGNRPASSAVSSALTYNRALMLAHSTDVDKQKKAVEQLEKYLTTTSDASAWWPIAYEHYLDLCKKIGTEPKSKKDIAKTAQQKFRTLMSLELPTVGKGVTIILNDPITKLEAALGKYQATTVVGSLKRLRYPDYGIDILATDRVLAILLVGPKAPKVALRGTGTASGTRELTVGMSKDELEQLVGGEDYDYRQLDDPDTNYRFYANLGLAVRVQKDKVTELVIATIPRRRSGLFAD